MGTCGGVLILPLGVAKHDIVDCVCTQTKWTQKVKISSHKNLQPLLLAILQKMANSKKYMCDRCYHYYFYLENSFIYTNANRNVS